MNTIKENKENPLVTNNVLIILAGMSGSGKSTFADFLEFMIDGCEIEICTADDYHYIDGEYKFDVNNLGRAHKWCQEKCSEAMAHNVRVVISANTNTSEWERNVYKKMADEHGYEVVELILNGGYTNVHNVPEDILKKQKQKLLDSLK